MMIRSLTRRALSTIVTNLETKPDKYALSIRWLHSIQAIAVIGALGCVNYAIRCPKTELGQKQKADAMFAHKSFGTLVFLTLPIRALVRLSTRAPAHLPSPLLLQFGASATHAGLYLGMAFLSTTGLAMTYASARPVPFFFTTLPTTDVANPEDAKFYYKLHKGFGPWWEFLVPLHIGGTVFHLAQGHRILARMNPFI